MRFWFAVSFERSCGLEAGSNWRDCWTFSGDWFVGGSWFAGEFLDIILRVEVVDERSADRLIQNVVAILLPIESLALRWLLVLLIQ